MLTIDMPWFEKRGICDQLQRAVVSISSNIAEGAAKPSDIEFAHFLDTALGSAFEVETQFMTVIYSMEYEEGENGILSGILNSTLNSKQKDVLAFITTTPGVQAQEIIERLSIPRDTLNKILKVLTDRDLIARRGSKKTGGYYAK